MERMMDKAHGKRGQPNEMLVQRCCGLWLLALRGGIDGCRMGPLDRGKAAQLRLSAYRVIKHVITDGGGLISQDDRQHLVRARDDYVIRCAERPDGMWDVIWESLARKYADDPITQALMAAGLPTGLPASDAELQASAAALAERMRSEALVDRAATEEGSDADAVMSIVRRAQAYGARQR
jgi:hypothetical protein